MSEPEEVLQILRGIVVNYRTGPKTQRSKEGIVQFVNVRSNSQAARLLGRKVVWSDSKRKIIGKVVAVHGKNGLVIVRFRRGLPGKTGIYIDVVG
ncbi:MAG: 50S ribosomal protein L35ae [Candidatus Bathyarchaeota archaeon]|nr:50S ribosomal protein L35ae [Candidatus Bathyarchaeota archaeon]UCC28032.1 MAG: 50S ribosomal protein L35ae [Candidatus Bathyarchaeota archaeon]